MKKILLMATAVAAMVSCAKTEVSEINPQSPSVISFKSPYVSSKAGDTGIANVATGLYVYANGQADNDKYKGWGSLIDGDVLKGTVSGEDYSWTFKKDDDSDLVYYWPTGGAIYNFYASYPEKLTSTAMTVTPATDADDQKDIVVAATSGKQGTTVSLNLKHILSRVDFTITVAEDIKMNIADFELINVASTATCTLAVPTGNAAPFSYSSLTGTDTYSYTSSAYAKAIDASSEAKTEILGNANKFMLLPQGIAEPTYSKTADTDPTAGQCIKITYGLKFGKKNTPVVADGTVAYIPLKVATGITAWEAGKSYMYTLGVTKSWNGGYDVNGENILKNPEISFSVEVDKWEPNTDDQLAENNN